MSDVLVIEPTIGVPFERGAKYVDLRKRAEAACNTVHTLQDFGLDIEYTDEDREVAATLAMSFAKDPEDTSKAITHANAAQIKPGAMMLVNSILTEFGYSVVQDSLRIRNLITNKLLIETEHNDAKIRLRAIELLGKLSDVGAFTEKSEITVNSQTSSDLKMRLKGKLHRLVRSDEEIQDVDVG